MVTPVLRASLQKGWNETACAQLIKQGSKSFYAASLLLPDRVRRPAYALYAFCRLSDDAVDAHDAPADAVQRLYQRLDMAYAGKPRAIPADAAFADLVERVEMPRALPEALLEGLAWDSQGWTPQTLSDVRAYSARVAAAVGAMMTVLMGVRDRDVLARACDLGVAMQLTNIARDVGEDARNGRTYLPVEWMEEVGLDRDVFLANPQFDDRVRHLVKRLLDEAEVMYERALPGIGHLPADCRVGIHGARLVYREIGRKLAVMGYNSVDERAYVPAARKSALLAMAAAQAVVSGDDIDEPPLPETAFLVDAVPETRPSPALLAGQAEPGSAGRFLELLAVSQRRG